MTLVRNSELTRTLYLPVAFRCYPKPVSPFGIEIDRLHLFPELLASEAERARYETEVYPDLLDAFKESGANWTRIMIRWRELEPEDKDPEDYAGWDYYDSKLAEYETQYSAVLRELTSVIGEEEPSSLPYQ